MMTVVQDGSIRLSLLGPTLPHCVVNGQNLHWLACAMFRRSVAQTIHKSSRDFSAIRDQHHVIPRRQSINQISNQTSSTTSSSGNIQKPKRVVGGHGNKKPVGSKRLRKRTLTVPINVPASKALRVSKVKPKTLQLYSEAVEEFESWANNLKKNLRSHKNVDLAMSEYLQYLCLNGESITAGSYTVFGWILIRSEEHLDNRMQLPFARQALKGWKARFPGHSRTGVDLSIWDLVALTACEQGHLLSGAAMVIQADAYLRPSEVFAITRDHLVPPSASRTRGIWGVIIGLLEGGMPTKAGDFDDVVLFDTKSRSDVNTVVASLARRSTSKSLCIFHPLTVEQYGKHIKAACGSLGLSNLHLTPHCLRHSGASHDAYHVLRDFTSIQSRGRWKAKESVRRYRRPGRMLLTQKQVSKKIWKAASSARPKLINFLLQNL